MINCAPQELIFLLMYKTYFFWKKRYWLPTRRIYKKKIKKSMNNILTRFKFFLVSYLYCYQYGTLEATYVRCWDWSQFFSGLSFPVVSVSQWSQLSTGLSLLSVVHFSQLSIGLSCPLLSVVHWYQLSNGLSCPVVLVVHWSQLSNGLSCPVILVVQ